jgi:hypothetical protein
MRLILTHRLLPVLAWLSLLADGCSSAGSPLTAEVADVPQRQFTLHQARIEERRHQQVVWTGTAERATGDRHLIDVQGICLRRQPQAPEQTPFVVVAQGGRLDFTQDGARFDVAVVQHAAGELRTPQAVYDGNAGRLDGAGPVWLCTPHGQTQASAGHLFVEEGRLELEGPVCGQFSPTPADPLPPPPGPP